MTAPVTSSISCTIEIPVLTEKQTYTTFTPSGTLIMPYNTTGINQTDLKNQDSSLLLLEVKRAES